MMQRNHPEKKIEEVEIIHNNNNNDNKNDNGDKNKDVLMVLWQMYDMVSWTLTTKIPSGRKIQSLL